MKKIISFVILLAVIGAFSAVSHAKRKEALTVVAGSAVPSLGMVFDASYDPRFDNFVSGYKVVQVAIMNNSFKIVPMDPKRDKYAVLTREGRKEYKAFANLREEDPKAWRELPERAQNVITYPLVLPIGARQVIDLFVPDTTPLDSFRGVQMDLHAMEAKIDVLAGN